MIDLLRLSLPSYQFLKRLSIGTMEEAQKKFLLSDLEDPRNANILCWIGSPEGGQLYPRDMAGISPFDSAVQGGDAVWEGLRVYRGKILTCNEHIGRLFRSAKAMGFTNLHTKEQVMEAIFVTLAANGMRDEAHIRLTLTRGIKCTSSMNPNFNLYGTTLIVLPEWKCASGGKTTYDNTKGITLITASQRRNSPQTVDSKIHHNNLINNILPKMQANIMGAADAIMLDLDGFVSETNATNIFMVDYQGTLLTPHADHCLPGITRDTVIALAKEDSIPVVERRISLAEFHAAEEVFTTGTMGGITPVTMIDGRLIGTGKIGATTKRLQELFAILPDRPEWVTELPPFSS
jgi:branched-chain amino acid aminotransferase group I